jgi:micrococcal nuclease
VIFLLLAPALLCAGQFKIIRVSDGDTVKAQGYDIEIKVRLVGIDAPETSRKKHDPGQPYSQKSKEYLAALVLNKTVDIRGYGLDRYGRVLGVIHFENRDINLEMVKAGLAEVYQGKPPKGFDLAPYLEAEQGAREAKKGMWSLGEKYISPRDWRKRD